jgi:ADP-ribosylglycohydrolase
MATRLPENYATLVCGALVAAAVGDALGWPQEIRSNIVGGQKARDVTPEPRFRQWDRNSGTQFARYRETIAAGEYSDDTQLLLAVARCCVAGDDWLARLTQVELPAWTLYQRGAGRSVIAAGRAWASGKPPWMTGRKSDRNRSDPVAAYFNAGANGAAMRIAPHAMLTIGSSTHALISRVVADGITTHGHPRALVGATVQALALRHALLHQGTLEYGDLMGALLDDHSWQDADWLDAILPPDWIRGFCQAAGHEFSIGWKVAVRETIELLLIAQRSLARGALANDEQTFGAFGCYDKTRNGSGTVTSVAAAYAATRAAARPITGLVRTAFLPRADTDTLASMTASLLGAIHGMDWMGHLAEDIQDAVYIRGLASRLASIPTDATGEWEELRFPALSYPGRRVLANDLDHFRDLLFSADQLDGRKFLDGRKIVAGERFPLEAAGKVAVSRARLTTEDGQTLVLDKVARVPPEESRQSPLFDTGIPLGYGRQRNSATIREITFWIADFQRSWRFYRYFLDLDAERTSDISFSLPNGLVFSEPRDHRDPRPYSNGTRHILISIEVKDITDVASRFESSHLASMVHREERHGRPLLRMHDPDGYELEVVEG